jgi:hypothetical protein
VKPQFGCGGRNLAGKAIMKSGRPPVSGGQGLDLGFTVVKKG